MNLTRTNTHLRDVDLQASPVAGFRSRTLAPLQPKLHSVCSAAVASYLEATQARGGCLDLHGDMWTATPTSI